ncbi:MAG: hypothetical protein ACOX81_02725 [Candidatus Heteroscillospira sp.]
MNIELTNREFRLLLDMAYIGNWVLNSTRGEDRIVEYDNLQEKLFAHCAPQSMGSLIQLWRGHIYPSREYEDGGIHEAIADYEDSMFFDILAEEMARRDMVSEQLNQDDLQELQRRMEEYISEFERNGIQNISLEP